MTFYKWETKDGELCHIPGTSEHAVEPDSESCSLAPPCRGGEN